MAQAEEIPMSDKVYEYKEDCGMGVAARGGQPAHQCNRPSKATCYGEYHTYPMRVCGTHARMREKQGLPVVWDE
jgi:hypothetical protein